MTPPEKPEGEETMTSPEKPEGEESNAAPAQGMGHMEELFRAFIQWWSAFGSKK